MKRIDLPTVYRRGSYIEPPCDERADYTTKLAYRAALVALDTGIDIALYEHETLDGAPVPDSYLMTVGHTGNSPMPLREAWAYLNGVHTGAAALESQTDRR